MQIKNDYFTQTSQKIFPFLLYEEKSESTTLYFFSKVVHYTFCSQVKGIQGYQFQTLREMNQLCL